MCVTVLASQPSESIPTEITFWICSPGLPGWPTVSTCRRSSSACCCLGQLARRRVARRRPRRPRSSAAAASASAPPAASACSSTFESMCSVRSGSHSSSIRTLLVVEGVLDPRRRLGAVGHGDHHRRRRCSPASAQSFARLQPVLAEQVVGVGHQIRQRLVRLAPCGSGRRLTSCRCRCGRASTCRSWRPARRRRGPPRAASSPARTRSRRSGRSR